MTYLLFLFLSDKLQSQSSPPAASADEADSDGAEGRHGPLLQQQQQQPVQQQRLRGRGGEW